MILTASASRRFSHSTVTCSSCCSPPNNAPSTHTGVLPRPCAFRPVFAFTLAALSEHAGATSSRFSSTTCAARWRRPEVWLRSCPANGVLAPTPKPDAAETRLPQVSGCGLRTTTWCWMCAALAGAYTTNALHRGVLPSCCTASTYAPSRPHPRAAHRSRRYLRPPPSRRLPRTAMQRRTACPCFLRQARAFLTMCAWRSSCRRGNRRATRRPLVNFQPA